MHPVPNTWQRFTTDIEHNRVLSSACIHVMTRCAGRHIWHKLTAIAIELSLRSNIDNIDGQSHTVTLDLLSRNNAASGTAGTSLLGLPLTYCCAVIATLFQRTTIIKQNNVTTAILPIQFSLCASRKSC